MPKDQSRFVIDLLIALSDLFLEGCTRSAYLETEIRPALSSTIPSILDNYDAGKSAAAKFDILVKKKNKTKQQ